MHRLGSHCPNLSWSPRLVLYYVTHNHQCPLVGAFASLMSRQCWQLEETLLPWAWDICHRKISITPQIPSPCLELCHVHSDSSTLILVKWVKTAFYSCYTTCYLVEFRIRGFHFTAHSSKTVVFLRPNHSLKRENRMTGFQRSNRKGHSFLFTLIFHLPFLVTSNFYVFFMKVGSSQEYVLV